MTTFRTLLLDPGETWAMVSYKDFNGTIPDPYQVDGTLEIEGKKNTLIQIETENIDVLWANIIGAIRDLLKGAPQTKALVPDFPGELLFRPIGNSELELAYDDERLRVNKQDFALSLATEAWNFYQKMCILLPDKSTSYQAQELTQLREIFKNQGVQPPS